MIWWGPLRTIWGLFEYLMVKWYGKNDMVKWYGKNDMVKWYDEDLWGFFEDFLSTLW